MELRELSGRYLERVLVVLGYDPAAVNADPGVDIESPWCAEAEDGFHCGHEQHRHALIGVADSMTIKCCWCDQVEIISINQVRRQFTGHGPGCTYEDEEWDLPVGWRNGEL